MSFGQTTAKAVREIKQCKVDRMAPVIRLVPERVRSMRKEKSAELVDAPADATREQRHKILNEASASKEIL
jgi:hypothetical protein